MTETALRTAKAVVVLWSKKSVQSRWVRAEATLADRNKTLVPCMIEPGEGLDLFLGTINASYLCDASRVSFRTHLTDAWNDTPEEPPS